jgi:hypothetical protein
MYLVCSVVQVLGDTLRTQTRKVTPGRRSVGCAAVVIMVGAVGVGSAHAQECDPVETAKLLAADGESSDSFGWSVSVDGDTAIIGARINDQNSCNGSARIFTRSGGMWTEEAELLSDNGGFCELFSGGGGNQVSISGDTAIVGAVGARDQNGVFTGAAHIFTRSGGDWTQQAKIFPTNGLHNASFGHAVFISGDTAVIGAPDDNEIGTNTGAAYVFTRSGDVWTQRAKLLPADGAPNSANFGYSVSVRGSTVVVGEPRDNENGNGSGSAYVFTESGGVWSQQAKLLPSVGTQNSHFGWSVSIDGDSALIGERRGGSGGAAYAFTRSGSVWTEQTKLNASDGSSSAEFGYSVSISGDSAVIGAWVDNNNNGTDSGSAYVFTRSGSVWTEQTKLLASDGAAGDVFGTSVSISGGRAFIGAHADDDNGNGSGSAYVFDLNCDDCRADLNGDGEVDTLDFLAFLGAWSASDPVADWNGDGVVNTLDFLAYLTDWVAGCP